MTLKRWHLIVPAALLALVAALTEAQSGDEKDDAPKIPPGYQQGYRDGRSVMFQISAVQGDTDAHRMCRSLMTNAFVNDGAKFETGWEDGCADALLSRPNRYASK
ncbi:hypothetical protein [Streptomyces sp. NPDC054958]